MTRRLRAVWIASVAAVACTQEPPYCPKEIAQDIHDATISAFNGTVGTGGSGATFNCPGGGSVTVTAMITMNGSGSRTEDDTYTFTSCHDTAASNLLTLTGTLHEHSTRVLGGTNSWFCTNCTYTSDALTIQGTELLCNANPIDATCAVHSTFMNETASTFGDESGSICGITYP